MPSDPTIAPSAFKHGIAREDILHAYAHAIRGLRVDDRFSIAIGPSRSAALLEIGISFRTNRPVIVHAMPARSKFLKG